MMLFESGPGLYGRDNQHVALLAERECGIQIYCRPGQDWLPVSEFAPWRTRVLI